MTTVTSPSDLLATVPFLIGYQPSDAIVLIALTDESISMAMRIDFPDSLTASEASGLATRIASENADAVLMVSYGQKTFSAVRKSVGIWKEALPQARVRELAGVGHLPISEGTEEVARIIFTGAKG